MSKESYIRGFCKAAESHGVNPVQLAKYAASNNSSAASGPKYKTEGYTPKFSDARNPINIPKVFHDGTVGANRWSEGWDIARPIELEVGLPNTPAERVRQIINPKHLAWLQAHTNALQRATAPLRAVGFPSTEQVPDDIQRAIEDMYHGTMYSTTSAVPAKVISPVKK